MRMAVMDTNVFNTIIAAVKGAVSTSATKPKMQPRHSISTALSVSLRSFSSKRMV